jgi:uncharacterized protein with HEPN domain
MSKIKISNILQFIDDIEYTVNQHQTIVNALNDRIAKYSVLMCLLQIGENLNKLKTNNENIIKATKGAYAVRNFIAHDYEGVNLAFVENIIKNLLQPLKEELTKELQSL